MANIEINITENGTTTLATAGKYCDRNVDVVVDVAGGVELPEEAFVVSDNCMYRFAYNGWNWFLEQFGDKITTLNISNAAYMFNNSSALTDIPFEFDFQNGGAQVNSMFANCTLIESIPSIDFNQTSYKDAGYLFQNCSNLKNIGTLKNLYPSGLQAIFYGCWNLRELPTFENLNLSRTQSYNYANNSNMFRDCRSLRNISTDFLRELYVASASYTSQLQYGAFSGCYALDEIKGIPVNEAITITSNSFNMTFSQCCRLKSIVFDTNDDGSVKTAKWKTQTIDLAGTSADYAVGNTYALTWVTGFNSGITEDKRVWNDETYQALKDDADWFANNRYYSRYNHDSAVETINSLPDTSAYLATAGGTNTIKFRGDAGTLTDGGAINTLTEAEIAVATAKGWTVTLV